MRVVSRDNSEDPKISGAHQPARLPFMTSSLPRAEETLGLTKTFTAQQAELVLMQAFGRVDCERKCVDYRLLELIFPVFQNAFDYVVGIDPEKYLTLASRRNNFESWSDKGFVAQDRVEASCFKDAFHYLSATPKASEIWLMLLPDRVPQFGRLAVILEAPARAAGYFSATGSSAHVNQLRRMYREGLSSLQTDSEICPLVRDLLAENKSEAKSPK